VDRCNLERHLNDTDFELVFELPRSDFYRLPLWKRSDLKKRVKLFWIWNMMEYTLHCTGTLFHSLIKERLLNNNQRENLHFFNEIISEEMIIIEKIFIWIQKNFSVREEIFLSRISYFFVQHFHFSKKEFLNMKIF